MAVLDVVVPALLPRRVPGEALGLAEPGEPGPAAGDQLVDVGLVAGVPQDGVGGRIEDAVEGEGQFDGAEVRAQVPGGLGDGGDDEVADLAAQLGQVGLGELAQVVGVTNPVEEHGRDATWARAALPVHTSYGRAR